MLKVSDLSVCTNRTLAKLISNFLSQLIQKVPGKEEYLKKFGMFPSNQVEVASTPAIDDIQQRQTQTLHSKR